MAKAPLRDDDALYRRLFSDPRIVAQFLRGFVDEPALADVDLDGMEPLPTKFHARTGERREGDMAWRIPRREGGDAYLALLLEFQSRSDQYMALRMLVYSGLLMQQLIDERRVAAGGKLPPLLPVVLFNGGTPWLATQALRDLIALPHASTLWIYQPAMRYYLVSTRTFSDAELDARDSLVALYFRLEAPAEPGQKLPVLDAIIAWIDRHPGFSGLRAVFRDLLATMINTMDPKLRVPDNLLEARNMFEAETEQWKRNYKSEGRKEGRQEGRQEGRKEGAATILLRLLEHRFGVLPEVVRDRVQAADTNLLTAWGMRILTAESLDGVFADPPPDGR
jgi:hypothetical protein